ncbi:MAG: hypothetical protein K2W96_28945 [Gemmataceae bacterium]|nr:hypothetical protein [Gemmataceae bacterium]
MSEVNPFEPWRPKEGGSSGRDEPLFPWSAPSRREPDPEDREIPYHERRSGRSEEPRVPPPSGANSFVALLAIALLIAGLIALGNNGGGHFLRVAATVGCFWLGALVGFSLLHRRGWVTRLGVVAGGIAAGLACWMFVPASGGMSWWQAQTAIQDIKRLPAGDFAGFLAQRAARDDLAAQFKGNRQEVEHALHHWVRATGFQLVAEMDDAGRDSGKALARLEEAEAALAGSHHRGHIANQLSDCWRKATHARLDELEKEAVVLAEKGQFARADALAREGGDLLRKRVAGRSGATDVDVRVKSARGKVFRLHLRQAKARLEALAAKADHEEIGRESRRLRIDLHASAALGERAALDEAILPFQADALRARLAKAKAALEEVLAKQGPAKVAGAAVGALADLEEDAKAAGMKADAAAALRPVRAKAFAALVKTMAEGMQAALDKKDHEAAEAVAKNALAVHADEAHEVGASEELAGTLAPLRKKAYLARLDGARERFRALLVKDDYAGIEALAEKTVADLAPIGDAVGERKALDDFTSRCRAFVKLAEAAGKKGDGK